VNRSYFIMLFIACFLFSLHSGAKALTTKSVGAQKTAVTKKKTAAINKSHIKNKKTVAMKAKKASSKKSITQAKVVKNKKATVAKVVKTKKAPVKKQVVRLDFEQKDVLHPKVKPRKELKKMARTEKAQKKSFKSIPCQDGYVVGHKAFCSTTAQVQPLRKVKNARSLASQKNLEAKKLK
jgi:hypothetical protein